MKIATHNGIFHADEISAIALIKLYINPNVEVIRTRNSELIESANIAIDVSGKYDGVRYFDHHHFTEDHEMYGLSSAGLILKSIIEERFQKVPKELSDLIDEIDQQDVGIRRNPEYHFCNIISRMNEDNIAGEEQLNAFNAAIDVAYRVFKAMELNYKKELIVDNCEPKIINGVKIVTLNKDQPFIAAALFAGKTDILIEWDNVQNNWSVLTVPLVKGEFGSEFTLESSNLDTEVFVHKAGFISKCNSDENNEVQFKIKGIADLIKVKVK